MKPSRPLLPAAALPALPVPVVAVVAAVAVAACGRAAEPQAPGAVPAAAVSPEEERFFESQVRPLLVARCQACHGDTVAEAGLRLDSRSRMLAGGDGGPVVVPGDPAASRLLAAVRHADGLAMPPDGKLTAAEISVLEAWVVAGLPWSGPGGDAGPPRSHADEMRARLEESRAAHWSFRPLHSARDPAVEPEPDGLAPAWRHSEIDRLVGGRLAAAGIAPAPGAAARDLVRRLWFDLTGLPPPAAEADAFSADPSERRYRDLVDRLLASPQHAEHWARKWLDLARYADTMGYAFAEQDPRYPFAWTYRDWVVDALAADMPYDRFVTLQIAADLVTPPVPPADLAALGFLTVGRTFLGNRHDIIDDQIDLVTRGLMGLTVACARCHDHKYEPVTMADYYALHGIFANSSVPEELPRIGPPPAGPEAEAFAAKLHELEADIERHVDEVHARATREAIAHAADYFLETARPAARKADGRPPRLADDYDLQQLMIDRMGRLLGAAADTHPVLGLWAAVRDKPDEEVAATVAGVLASWQADAGAAAAVNPLVRDEMLSARPVTLPDVAAAFGRLALRVAPEMAGGVAAEPDEPAALAELRAVFGAEGTPLVVPRGEAMRVAGSLEHTRMRKLKQAVTRHTIEAAGGPPRAMVVRDAEQPGDSRIFLRGNPGRPGDVVARRLPELLGGAPTARDTSGRLDLAQGIVDPDNPLTPRMLVNWVWTHHFGTGLVATADDLGLRGEPPAHPELLDALARRFVTEGAWSLRWLHREIVTSRTWRQSATIRPELVATDPENRLLARAERRRLDWEAWRDSLLVAAGTLDASGTAGPRGGPGIDPLASAHLDARSLYTKLDRQNVPGMLRTFDIANPDTAVHVRPRTTVPQQSLAALNAPLVVEAARRAAARVGTELGGSATRERFVTALWRAVLARSPHDDERAAAVVWLEREEALDERAAAEDPAAEDPAPAAGMPARARLAHALMATAEFQYVD